MLPLQELRKDGFDLAEARYRELKPILDEVKLFPFFFVIAVFEFINFLENQTNHCFNDSEYCPCTLQLAILEAEQKAEEQEAEASSSKRGKKKNKR